MIVIKRDGRKEEYNDFKIFKAIMKAAASVGCSDYEDVAWQAVDDIRGFIKEIDHPSIDVETIQDMIEIELYAIGNNPVIAKEFILYREKRRQEREKAEKYSKIIQERAINPEESNANQNANVDELSFSGRMYEASEALWKETALDDFMPDYLAKLHRDMELYWHDASRIAVGENNCLTIDLSYILEHGLKTRQSSLRPPNRFSTACQQIAVIFQIISQCQFGGIAAPYIDRTLAPFIQKSRERIKRKFPDMDTKNQEALLADEIKQGAESLVHNLSSLQSRAGSQLPFSSLNLGADVDPDAQRVTKAILEAMIDGVGVNHSTPAFPILCFQVKKGINRNPEDPGYDNYRLAIKCATRRLTPNFVNLDSSVCHSNDDPDTWLTAMGCRTQLGFNRFNKDQPYKRVGRGNLAPHTIIPVALGIKHGVCQGKRATPDLAGFWKDFEDYLKKAEESLLIRANLIFNQKMSAAYELYVNHVWMGDYEYDPNKSTYDVLKNGTFVIGILGIANTCYALFGKNHYESEEAKQFALELTKKVSEFCAAASDRNNLNFASYATPAENLCYTAMKKLKERFGEIEGVTDSEYLTNSYHVPVSQDCDVFDKIKFEADFAKYYTGGNICYVEFDSTAIGNIEGVEQIINFAMDNDIPYFAINFPLDECPVCGYSGEIPYSGCPMCGCEDEKINRLRRVTGYINQDYRSSFNLGKQAEVKDRVKHTKGVDVQL